MLALRNEGYDVCSIAEVSPGIDDWAVLQKGFLERRIIVTFDKDYGELIFKKKQTTCSGIILLRFDPLYPEEPGERLLSFLRHPDIIFENRFTVIERDTIRQRSLAIE
ncbi:DUF5615 family PIN-like protein [bacterium]|nr:DUF5615 family PIN-like protein [bacterium]